MVTGMGTVLCQVADMDRATAFYRDVLGLPMGYSSPHWSTVKIGSQEIGLHPLFGEFALDSERKQGWILGIVVDDLRALRTRVEAAAVWTSDSYHDTPAGVVWDFCDPDGNPIQAMQMGAKAADLG